MATTCCFNHVHMMCIRVFLSVEAIYRAPHLADCLAMNLAMNSSIMYVPPLGLVCAESISHILILTNR